MTGSRNAKAREACRETAGRESIQKPPDQPAVGQPGRGARARTEEPQGPGPHWSGGHPDRPSTEQLFLLHNANMVDKETLPRVWRLNHVAPFHAGDAGVSAGLAGICWGGGAQGTGEPLQTETPRFVQQRGAGGPRLPLVLQEASEGGL